MAIVQAEKYQKDVYKVNEELQDRFWQMIKTAEIPPYLPDIDRILVPTSNNDSSRKEMSLVNDSRQKPQVQSVNFKIGDTVTNDIHTKAPSSLCFGEGDHTASLINDNEQLRLT